MLICCEFDYSCCRALRGWMSAVTCGGCTWFVAVLGLLFIVVIVTGLNAICNNVIIPVIVVCVITLVFSCDLGWSVCVWALVVFAIMVGC